MQAKTIIIINKLGLHARAAAKFVQTASAFQSDIMVTSSNREVSGKSIMGMIYLTHWFVVMPITTLRMSIRPKRLKWVKTVHEGAGNESFEF